MSTLAPAIDSDFAELVESLRDDLAKFVISRKPTAVAFRKQLEGQATRVERLVGTAYGQIVRGRSVYSLVVLGELAEHVIPFARSLEATREVWPALVDRLEAGALTLRREVRRAESDLAVEAASDPLIAYLVASKDLPHEEIKRRETIVFQAWRVRKKHAETFKLLA